MRGILAIPSDSPTARPVSYPTPGSYPLTNRGTTEQAVRKAANTGSSRYY